MKLEDQKKHLEEEIIIGNADNYFAVHNIEAGGGKTTVAELAVVKAYLKNGTKSLFVRNRIEDCNYTVEKINSHARERGLNKEIAITLNSSTKTKIKKNINIAKMPIIVITHQKYKQLCLNKYDKELFSKGRKNLIIDEEIDMLEVISYSRDIYLKYLTYFPSEDNGFRKLYQNFVKEILYLINSTERNQLHRFNESTIKTKKEDLKTLIKFIDNHELDEFIIQSNPFSLKNLKKLKKEVEHITKHKIKHKINSFLEINLINKPKLKKHIEEIFQIYKNIIVVNNEYGEKIIHAYNRNYHWWRLDNNILLDANGGFNYAYELSQDFKVKHYDFTVDHSAFHINYYDVSTSKSAKRNYLNFYQKINSHLRSNILDSKKTLLVSNKSEFIKDSYKIKKIDFVSQNYFGNLIGSNDYRDYDSIYVTHTPYYPSYIYVLKYIFYSDENINIENIDINYNNKAEFNHNSLEKMKSKTILGEVYQAVKRINRNNKLKSHIHLFMKNKKVIKELNILLKDSIIMNQNLKIDKMNNRKEEYDKKRFNKSYAKKFINLLQDFSSSKDLLITKKAIREKLGCSSQKFSRIIKHTQVKETLEKLEIESKYHKLVKSL